MALQHYLRTLPANNEALHIIGPFFHDPLLPQGPKIYVDRGSRFRSTDEGFTVGDGDSHLGDLDEILDPKKDFSDLAYVFRNLDDRLSLVYLHGFLGGRFDHEIMNLAEVHTFLRHRKRRTEVHLDDEVMAFSAGGWSLHFNGVFSLFTFEKAKVCLDGQCEFRLLGNTVLRPVSSHGLSNVGFGDISLICDAPVFVFFNSRSESLH